MTDLQAFIDSRSAMEFSRGLNDCCLFAADWVLACTGRDPAAQWRDVYKTKRAAVAVLRGVGGMETLGEKVIVEAGFRRATVPVVGSVGVIELPGVGRICAIFSGTMWVAMAKSGVRAYNPAILPAPEAVWNP